MKAKYLGQEFDIVEMDEVGVTITSSGTDRQVIKREYVELIETKSIPQGTHTQVEDSKDVPEPTPVVEPTPNSTLRAARIKDSGSAPADEKSSTSEAKTRKK